MKSYVVGIGYVPVLDAVALEADGWTVYHYWSPGGRS